MSTQAFTPTGNTVTFTATTTTPPTPVQALSTTLGGNLIPLFKGTSIQYKASKYFIEVLNDHYV